MEQHAATNWVPGIIVFATAALAALLFVVNQRRSTTPQKKSTEDLDERYQFLLGQLKEHAAAKHLLAAADWAAEQARLEGAAADILRQRAGAQHESVKAQARAEKLSKDQAADTGFFARNPALKGAFIGGSVVAFFVVLGIVLTQQSHEKTDDPMARGPMQGKPPMAAAQGPSPEDQLKELRARAAANPDDVDNLADVAGELIKLQAFEEALPIVSRATGIDPFHVQTRIWRAVMQAVEGKPLVAVDELEHLADTYQGAYKARLYGGLLCMETKQEPRALAQLEKYLAEAPPSQQPPFIRMAVQQLKQELATTSPKENAP